MTFDELRTTRSARPGPLAAGGARRRHRHLASWCWRSCCSTSWCGTTARTSSQQARGQQEQQLRDEFQTKHAKAVNLDALQAAARRTSSVPSARCCASCPARPRCPTCWSTSPRPAWPPALQQKLFQPQPQVKQGFLRRAADQDPPDRQLPPVGRVRQRHRRAAAHRDAARRGDHAGRARTRYDQLQMDLTAKTYRYLDDEEIAAAEADRARPDGRDQPAWIEWRMMKPRTICAGRGAVRLVRRLLRRATPTWSSSSSRPSRNSRAASSRCRRSSRTTASSIRAQPALAVRARVAWRRQRPGRAPGRASATGEFLEQFSLDTLKMVGTLQAWATGSYGLVQDAATACVHRVVPGNYLGQNDGRITPSSLRASRSA